jgi:hypothetical protein
MTTINASTDDQEAKPVEAVQQKTKLIDELSKSK